MSNHRHAGWLHAGTLRQFEAPIKPVIRYIDAVVDIAVTFKIVWHGSSALFDNTLPKKLAVPVAETVAGWTLKSRAGSVANGAGKIDGR